MTLGGFAPVALGMFPDAADRPSSAYQDLTPTALPDDAPVDEVRGQDSSCYTWGLGLCCHARGGELGLSAAVAKGVQVDKRSAALEKTCAAVRQQFADARLLSRRRR